MWNAFVDRKCGLFFQYSHLVHTLRNRLFALKLIHQLIELDCTINSILEPLQNVANLGKNTVTLVKCIKPLVLRSKTSLLETFNCLIYDSNFYDFNCLTRVLVRRHGWPQSKRFGDHLKPVSPDDTVETKPVSIITVCTFHHFETCCHRSTAQSPTGGPPGLSPTTHTQNPWRPALRWLFIFLSRVALCAQGKHILFYTTIFLQPMDNVSF